MSTITGSPPSSAAPISAAWSAKEPTAGQIPLSGESIVRAIGAIQEMSQRLFPGPIGVEHAVDPEDPTDQWLVFDVVAQGEYKDYRDRVFQWHEEVDRIVPGALCEFRLSVLPQP